MTDTITPTAEKSRKLKKTLFALTLGGAAGFIGAFGFMQLANSGVLGSLGTSRETASLVGITYVITAVAVLAGVVAPKAGATFLNVEDAEELREQKFMLGMSGAGMAAAGAALLIAALAAPGGPIAQSVAAVIFAGLMIVAVAGSIASRKQQDELMRAISKETGSTAYYLMFLVGGAWALAAHLDYLPAPMPLDWLTMFWALGLLAAFIVIAKRGMMQMR